MASLLGWRQLFQVSCVISVASLVNYSRFIYCAAIFTTTMISLWISQGENVTSGAVGTTVN